MKEQDYKAIVEGAFDELIAALRRDEAQRRLCRRTKNPIFRIWNFVSEEITASTYGLLLTRPHSSDSLIARTIYRVYNLAFQLNPYQVKSFRTLEDCLWKQWVTKYNKIFHRREFVAVPVMYDIAVQRELAPKWKFRILVQRFAREVFDQTLGGISSYECRERTAQTEAVSYVVSKVFGLESSRFTVWCIRQCRVDVKCIEEAKDWLQTFCLQLLAEMSHDQNQAMVQLCDLYGEVSICGVESSSPLELR